MKRPFDLSFYNSHPDCKVETRDGKPARIVCTDLLDECEQHIVALVQYTAKQEKMISVCANGEYKGSYGHDYDLFIATDEPEELTEFEEKVYELLDNVHAHEDNSDNLNKWIREQSDELLSLAREQLIQDGYIIEKKAFHDAVEKVEPEVMKEVEAACELAFKTADEVQYRKGQYDVFKSVYPIDTPDTLEDFGKRQQEDAVKAYNKGHEEGKLAALKDLPRWTRFANGYFGKPAISNHPDTGKTTIEYNGRWIYLDDVYKALPVDD